jgi:hypothetical protein
MMLATMRPGGLCAVVRWLVGGWVAHKKRSNRFVSLYLQPK